MNERMDGDGSGLSTPSMRRKEKREGLRVGGEGTYGLSARIPSCRQTPYSDASSCDTPAH